MMHPCDAGALSWKSISTRDDKCINAKSIHKLYKLDPSKQIGSASRSSSQVPIELSSDSDIDLDLVTEVEECIFRDAVKKKRKRRTSWCETHHIANLVNDVAIPNAHSGDNARTQNQRNGRDVKKNIGESWTSKQPPKNSKSKHAWGSSRSAAITSPTQPRDNVYDKTCSDAVDITRHNNCAEQEFEDCDPFAETKELQSLIRTSAQQPVTEEELGVILHVPKWTTPKKLRLPQTIPFLKQSNHRPTLLASRLGTPDGTAQCLHTDFSYLAVLKIAARLKAEKDIIESAELSNDLTTLLPRRSAKDIYDFINENDLGDILDKQNELKTLCSKPRSIYVDRQNKRDWLQQKRGISCGPNAFISRELGASPNTRRGREHVRDAVLPGLLKASRIFRGTSGDVNAIDFSPAGNSAIIGSIATDDEFNRSGNLIMLRADQHQDMSQCHVLDAKNRASNRYPTISCVRFVREGSFFLAGGADETLKVYSASGRFLHDKSRKNRACTHDIVTSSKHASIAFSCHSSGHLDVHTFRDDGVSSTYSLHYHDSLEPATAVYQEGLDQLVVGYQAKSPKTIAGQASIIDATKMTVLRSFRGEESYAHICAGENGLWAAGTNPRFSGLVKIFDARCEDAVVKSFRNEQTDINEVAVCEHYVTSAATDGTCFVWDIRKSTSYEPLHVLQHGKPIHTTDSDDICGITGSLFFNSSRFVTGGSDGVVKLWDLGVSEPWVKDLAQVVSPITRMALSREKDQMMIGENRGDVHLWSIRGNGVQKQLIEEPL